MFMIGIFVFCPKKGPLKPLFIYHCQWFSPGTPASSTTKTGRHGIAECGTKHQNQSINNLFIYFLVKWNMVFSEQKTSKKIDQ